MKTKKFIASTMRQALKSARDAFGQNAVIINHREIDDGIELEAGIEDEQQTMPIIEEIDLIKSTAGLPTESSQKATVLDVLLNKEDTVPSVAPIINKPNRTGDILRDDSDVLRGLREELAFLRQALHNQNNEISMEKKQLDNPYRTLLKRRLKISGFHPKICRRIAKTVDQNQEFNLVWQDALALLLDDIPTMNHDMLEMGGIIALVGPTGVGKTTTIAKLATRFALKNDVNDLGLITTDSYRVAGREQLCVYGRLLGSNVLVVKNNQDLDEALSQFSNKKLVLIDTAGISQRDNVNLAKHFSLISENNSEIKSLLTIASTCQTTVLNEIFQAFNTPNLAGCIITKIDESPTLGDVLSIPIMHHLPISYTSHGQRVPQDLAPADAKALLDLAISLVSEDIRDISTARAEDVLQED